MKKYIVLLIFVVFLFSACSETAPETESASNNIRIEIPLYEYPSAYITPEMPYDGYLTAVMPLPADESYPIELVVGEDIFQPLARWYNENVEEKFYHGEITADNVLDVSHVMFFGFTGSGIGRGFEILESVRGYDIYKFNVVMNDFMEEQLESNESFAPYLEELLIQRSYDYFIVDGENILKISFEPFRLEAEPEMSREDESAMFDEMIKNIQIFK
ncbi:MAG: hypothetical protein FWD48_00995 [Oscillospiraceae bacterium]|nr:hypothetical protein [Oscillospiraceae bacterium]